MNKKSLLLTWLAVFIIGFAKAQSCEITPQLVVDPGSSVTGSYSIGYADTWSGAIPGTGVSGQIVLADDGITTTTATAPFSITYAAHDLCDTAINDVAIMGKIAVVVRGSCSFQSKAEKVQADGAIACIIINNTPGGGAMGMGGTAGTVTIPVVSISYEDGLPLILALLGGETPTGTIYSDVQLLNDITYTNCSGSRWKNYAEPEFVTTSGFDTLVLGSVFYNNGTDSFNTITVNSSVDFIPAGGGPSSNLYSNSNSLTSATYFTNNTEGVATLGAFAWMDGNPATNKRGEYSVTYSSPADDAPGDNSTTSKWIVSDTILSKCSFDATGKLAAGGNTGYGNINVNFGSVYQINNDILNDAGVPQGIKKVLFRSWSPDTLISKQMQVDIYKWVELDETDTIQVIASEMTNLFSTIYTFPDNDQTLNRQVVLPTPIAFEANTKYVVALTPLNANLYIYADNQADFTTYIFSVVGENVQPSYDAAADASGLGEWNTGTGLALASALVIGDMPTVLDLSYTASAGTMTISNVTAGASSGTTTWTVNGSPAGTGTNITYTYPGDGTYNICMYYTNALGVVDTLCETVVVAGIEDNTMLDNALNVYPNPSNGILNININGANFNEINVEVVNQMGQTVLSANNTNLINNTATLNLSNLAVGIYYVKVSAAGFNSFKKITLEK